MTITVTFLICIAANAHENDPVFNEEMYQVSTVIFLIGCLMLFIINVLKRILEYRLKNKIIDKGISETVAASILQSNSGENKNANIKWFSILAGIGIGLTFVNFSKPFGFHSLAIMAFSISLSFLGYYFFIRYTEK